METWRPATESAASLLHWGKIRQGEGFVLFFLSDKIHITASRLLCCELILGWEIHQLCCRAAPLHFFIIRPPPFPSTHLLVQDSVGAGGPLAKLPGFGQYDHVLHGHPGPLPRQRDRQLTHTHLLVHSTSKEMDLCVHCNRKLKSHQMNELFMSWLALRTETMAA